MGFIVGFAVGGFFIMTGLLGLGRALIEIEKLKLAERRILKNRAAGGSDCEDKAMFDEFGMRYDPLDDGVIYDEYGACIRDPGED